MLQVLQSPCEYLVVLSRPNLTRIRELRALASVHEVSGCELLLNSLFDDAREVRVQVGGRQRPSCQSRASCEV